MDPLELLPQELWRLIFEKVEEPQDWLNLYRASPTFEEVVGDERTRALLPQVFPLLREHLMSENETASELLPLRLVSKHCKKTVDTSLEPSEAFDVMNNIHPWEIGWKYDFSDSRIISRFLNTFDTHPGNPIIGSFVQLFFHLGQQEEMRTEYSRSVRRLMNRFGNQISKLYIFCLLGNSPSANAFVDVVRSCVQLAPNLEGLSVLFFGMEDLNFLNFRLDNPILGNHPLPITSKLKSFVFDGFGEPGALVALQNILVRLCCNPDTLKSAGMVGVPPQLTTFPNLETASVVVSRLAEDATNLLNSSWPLTRLTLRRREDGVIPLALNAVFVEIVEHFKETLTSLWISSEWGPPEPNLELSLSLDLPRLEYLVLHRQLMFRPLPLLGSLPGLRKLGIFDDYYHELSDNGYVKRLFEFLETQFSEYKMWEVLPKLVQLEVVRLLPGSFVSKLACKVYYREKTTSSELGN